MGVNVPVDGENKAAILEAAETDNFRGSYLPWGGVHYFSMFLGTVVGGQLVYSVWFIQKLW